MGIIPNSLQLREIFHLEFLRWFTRKTKAKYYVLKGGTNLRFFFNSFRYSEDMDLDINGVEVNSLKDIVMKILQLPSFLDTFKPFGIEEIVPPEITHAKQTTTTQRFKIHLITSAGEDLFTKIEFSRRDMSEGIVVQSILDSVLRTYKLVPLITPHYDASSTTIQKIIAVASRSVIQARDIFDLYVLSSQYGRPEIYKSKILKKDKLDKAYENLFSVTFEQFRDSVVLFLPYEEQTIYGTTLFWDEIKLKVANLIEDLMSNYD